MQLNHMKSLDVRERLNSLYFWNPLYFWIIWYDSYLPYKIYLNHQIKKNKNKGKKKYRILFNYFLIIENLVYLMPVFWLKKNQHTQKPLPLTLLRCAKRCVDIVARPKLRRLYEWRIYDIVSTGPLGPRIRVLAKVESMGNIPERLMAVRKQW